MDIKVVKVTGRFRGRWRFRTGRVARPRGDLEEPVPGAEDSGSGAVPRVDNDGFKGEWKVISSGSWDRAEAMVVLEGRSVVQYIKHTCRNTANFHTRHLLL
jgi:hypothetical protein